MNATRSKARFRFFHDFVSLVVGQTGLSKAPPRHPAARQESQLGVLRNNQVTPSAYTPVPGRHKIGKMRLCQQNAAQVTGLLSGKGALPECPPIRRQDVQPLRVFCIHRWCITGSRQRISSAGSGKTCRVRVERPAGPAFACQTARLPNSWANRDFASGPADFTIGRSAGSPPSG